MRIELSKDAAGAATVDRDGHANVYDRQGLNVYLGHGLGLLHFEDEADAEHVALAILKRLGWFSLGEVITNAQAKTRQ